MGSWMFLASLFVPVMSSSYHNQRQVETKSKVFINKNYQFKNYSLLYSAQGFSAIWDWETNQKKAGKIWKQTHLPFSDCSFFNCGGYFCKQQELSACSSIYFYSLFDATW